MTITQNGALAAQGTGAAVLGGPLLSCTWLANKLLEFGVSLQPGDIVISGALMKMLPFRQGDGFQFSLSGQPDLAVEIVWRERRCRCISRRNDVYAPSDAILRHDIP